MTAPLPKVLIAVLAKQKEPVLPLYLRCLDQLDYPKDRISLYIRTNNNTDRTEQILLGWAGRVAGSYAHVEVDVAPVPERVERFGVHEWNAERFKVLGAIRQRSMDRALRLGCDFYFVADVDNFVRPGTLRALVDLDLPIAAPMLRHVDYPQNPYSNWHEAVDANGYYVDHPRYYDRLHRTRAGVEEVPVVHCTYLVRADAVRALAPCYDDGSGRYEYVVFSDRARRCGVSQVLDNRVDYGVLTLDEDPAKAEVLLREGRAS